MSVLCKLCLLLSCTLAHADRFTCALDPSSTGASQLPNRVTTSFDDRGQSVTLANTEVPERLNLTLAAEDRLEGMHLFYQAAGVEAEIVPLSVESFAMTLKGKDATSTWTGAYVCTSRPPESVQTDSI